VGHSQQGLLQFASFQSQQSTCPIRQEISSSALRNRSRAVSKLSIRSSSSAEKLLIDINSCIVGKTLPWDYFLLARHPPVDFSHCFENEQLLEITNRTAHAGALSALSEIKNAYRFYFAVYVYSVGRFTPIYVALINSFRKLVVYPSLLRSSGGTSVRSFGSTSRSSLFVVTIILVTHPTRGGLTKDRDPSASQVENRLAESGADPMSPPLGATSGNFELDAIHRSGVSVDRRTWLLEHHVPSGGYFFAARRPCCKELALARRLRHRGNGMNRKLKQLTKRRPGSREEAAFVDLWRTCDLLSRGFATASQKRGHLGDPVQRTPHSRE
jgi:hypothetical protein